VLVDSVVLQLAASNGVNLKVVSNGVPSLKEDNSGALNHKVALVANGDSLKEVLAVNGDSLREELPDQDNPDNHKAVSGVLKVVLRLVPKANGVPLKVEHLKVPRANGEPLKVEPHKVLVNGEPLKAAHHKVLVNGAPLKAAHHKAVNGVPKAR
jgi:hypothetical protein